MLMGQIRPIDFSVPETNLFTLGFWSTIKEEIEMVDELLEDETFFSITPDYAKVIMLGRIKKLLQKGGRASYLFVVDQVRTRKAIDESKNAS